MLLHLKHSLFIIAFCCLCNSAIPSPLSPVLAVQHFNQPFHSRENPPSLGSGHTQRLPVTWPKSPLEIHGDHTCSQTDIWIRPMKHNRQIVLFQRLLPKGPELRKTQRRLQNMQQQNTVLCSDCPQWSAAEEVWVLFCFWKKDSYLEWDSTSVCFHLWKQASVCPNAVAWEISPLITRES